MPDDIPAPEAPPEAPPGDAPVGMNPFEAPPEPPQELPDFSSIVPKEYADEPWVKDTKDIQSFFKRFKDNHAMAGQKPAGIPQDTASPEEWATFHKAMGVPEEAGGYVLPETPEGTPRNELFDTGIKDLLHGAHVSQKQYDEMAPKFDALMASLQEAENAARDVQFSELSGKLFGDNQDQAFKVAKSLMAKYAPEGMQEHIDKLGNYELMVMTSVLNGVQKDFISEDQLPDDPAVLVPGQSVEELRTEARRLQASPEYTDFTKTGHEETRNKIRGIYDKIAKIVNKPA